ncbi:sigma-70 family RNA polymerase sigma factor [uncultured Bacteroides sp.]|uniref:RNA polymerase sigma factor n=1 Tax=uncultured Bacteroides sp. TaxID=162156 RepID=UPI002AAB0AE8|nr:sigma-70 family RNA polymerase sigma factor [uncultured Bacteroides sp.]
MEDELELVKGCRAGNNTARKGIYTLYSKRLLAVCYRYTGDIDVAHDLLHDGFIKIYKSISKFDYRGEGSLELWMSRVMANLSLDYLQQRKKMQEVIVREEELPDVVELPEKELYGDISDEQLMLFVTELPAGYRTVFNLYVFEEKTHKEIAAMLHINEHSSTSQLHRAKCMLAKRIKEYIRNEEK